MRNGFLFDHTLCVNCKACIAACSLENSFPVEARSVLTYNSQALSAAPLLHLSIACNHCEIPACLTSCPSSSYYRDESSNAILIDDSKCIGCNYCSWNCPFGAPKLNPANGIIGKCNLCQARLKESMMPACTEACPTGALSFGNIEDIDMHNNPEWFTGAQLNPAMRFKTIISSNPLRIIPGPAFGNIIETQTPKRDYKGDVWSLTLFSFLSTFSVSLITSSLINGIIPGVFFFIALTLLAGVISVFHLGKWQRSWRSVINFRTSPLSREILIYLIYSLISSLSVIYQNPYLIVAAACSGVLLLAAIDAVYIFSERGFKANLHSGHTLLTALLMISFLSGRALPFIFIGTVKLLLSLREMSGDAIRNSDNRVLPLLRHLRIALLIVSGASISTGISFGETSVAVIFMLGEFADRVLFYNDFKPDSLEHNIIKHITHNSYEKERD